MTDPITRLNAALEGRYRIEREVGPVGNFSAAPPPGYLTLTRLCSRRNCCT